MRSARAGLAVALIVLAGCGGSKKKPATDAGLEVGAAGSAGQAGAAGAGGAGAGGGTVLGVDAAAGTGTEAAGAGGARPDAATETLADGPAPDTSADAGVEAPPPAPGSPLRALAVSTGTLHTCALLDNHRIKCWGRNDDGALGLGDMRSRGATAADMGDNLPFVDLGTGRTAQAVSAGRYHTCAILDDGSVKCWGLGFLTGLPALDKSGSVGDEPGEMGDHLPALELGGRKARLLASSVASSCATFDDGTTWCWGGSQGATPVLVPLDPHPEAIQLSPFHFGVVALFADGTVSRVLPNNGALAIAQPDKIVYVAGGETTGCFVGQDGTAACSLQRSEPWEGTTGLEAMGLTYEGTCGLFDQGAVRCWGPCGGTASSVGYWCGPARLDNSFPVALGQPAIAIATGAGYHTCALLSDGGVKCWSLTNTLCPTSGNDPVFVPCVPAQDGQDPNLGSSVEVVTTNGLRSYGAWHEIDLGTHP